MSTCPFAVPIVHLHASLLSIVRSIVWCRKCLLSLAARALSVSRHGLRAESIALNFLHTKVGANHDHIGQTLVLVALVTQAKERARLEGSVLRNKNQC